VKKPLVSHDPHFLNWPRRPNDPKNLFNNCFSFAVGNADSQNNFANRDHPAIRQPEPGDAIGMPAKIYTLAHGFTAATICQLFSKMEGVEQVKVNDYDRLPEAPEGKRMVAMWFLPPVGGKISSAMYHWAKQEPADPANPNAPRLFNGKMADEPPSTKDARGNDIVDPRYATFRPNQEGPFFFFIPEEGLNLHMHPDWVGPVTKAYDHQAKLREGKPVPELSDAFSAMAGLIKPGTDARLESFVRTVVSKNTATATLT